jgi:predicted ester cyclase
MSTDENKRVVRRYFEEFHDQRALSIADEILAPELREPTLTMTRMMANALPDYRVTIVDQVAEGDKVSTVWTAQGTHEGNWMSPIGPIPASGKPVTWTGTTTLRVRDGQIAEVIGSNWDHLGILQHMGVVPDVARRAGA